MSKTTQENDACCGHSHGEGSTASGKAPAETSAEIEFDGDVTRSACCIRDQQDYERAQALLKKLRKVDPTRIAVEQRQQVVLDTLNESSYAEYLNELRQEDLNERVQLNKAEVANATNEQEGSESDSSFVDSEDEAVLRRMAQLRFGSAPQTSTIECKDEAALRQALRKGNRVCCLFHEATQDALSLSVKQKLERLQRNFPTITFLFMEMSRLGRTPHPLIQAAFKDADVAHRPPVLVAFDSGMKVVGGLLAKDLEKMASFETWIETLPFDARKGENEDSADEDEDASLGDFEFTCDKEGCSRRFFHKHVQRLNKAAEMESK